MIRQHFLDGRFVDSESPRTIDVINRATQEVIAKVPDGTKEDVDRAVKAARKAFETGPWPETTAQERGRILFRLAQVVRDHAKELAELETINNGNPIVDAEVDIAAVSERPIG
jgi:acyl-CoA reductase-like NAD-dependent aldehyde dehydrogenase